MKRQDLVRFNPFSNEIAIHIYGFSSLMENWILCNMPGSLVVTIKGCSILQVDRKILEQPSHPKNFVNYCGHDSIFSLR
ncbi:hypothetical protein Hdeb2414_s0006g00202931 [Helianthus debilis subsp. tardiflorus]